MAVIGIELNHVLRNINKQLLKYYAKEYDNTMDWESEDDTADVIHSLSFPSRKERYRFMYIDYPYEIFGCANVMEQNLASKFNAFLKKLEDLEGKDVTVVLYALDEGDLALQSTYFFLSKCGIRNRHMMFPTSIDEVVEEMDYIVTANRDVIDKCGDEHKAIRINKVWNKDCKAYKSYDSLGEFLDDNNFILNEL
jgi:hypothetical protein